MVDPTHGKSSLRRWFPSLIAWLVVPGALTAADDFTARIKPILQETCLDCHSTKKQKGDLDLERFGTQADVRRDSKVWEAVVEQVASGEMPPKKEKPLGADAKRELLHWTMATLDEIAKVQAGDPGPVVLRRLSNVEYTYALRDLTGLPALDPAREFPTDGSAGEGFTNVGSAQGMSPALLGKYLDAAKEVSRHAVLLPDGIAFSAQVTRRDWTNEKMAAIKGFYARYTTSSSGESRLVQGIKVDLSGAEGRLPLERYLTATLTQREALQSGRRSVAQVAQELGLNAKYLSQLWAALNDSRDSFFLEPVRAAWRQAGPTGGPALAALINGWQSSLWRFGAVGHIGKLNGPQAWQLPVNPIVTHEEFSVTIPPTAEPKITLSAQVVRGEAVTKVEWTKARIVVKGRPDFSVDLPPPTVTGSSSSLVLTLPSGLPKDALFRVECQLTAGASPAACIQTQVATTGPRSTTKLVPTGVPINRGKGEVWSDGEGAMGFLSPLLVTPGGQAQRELRRAAEEFRNLFPIALCYARIVPVDEVVTLTLFHREDEALRRLMLDDEGLAELDRLWSDLRFISQDALLQVESFESLYQFATQDANPKAFEPLREPIKRRAAEFQAELLTAEPRQLAGVVQFASNAWRRPLTGVETEEFTSLYKKLRSQGMAHDPALRALLARVLVSSAFLYRGEQASAGSAATPVNAWELATRLSFFLWSSLPDAELRSLAATGRLAEPAVLSAQLQRMTKDVKISRLGTEFGGQWLHVRDLATLDEKSERHFPAFVGLRGAMQEEVERFFADFFQENRRGLALLDADYTFVNGPLARFYGLPSASEGWHRVDGVRAVGRGGVLGFAATLAKQSGASRTSPILRGNWVSEVLLGEKLPRPPKGVPLLPERAPAGLTERQLIERHTTDPACARCHERIDPLGFALENFDAIGRWRTQDVDGLAIDTRTTLAGGIALEGLPGLRKYLRERRQDDFLRQFSRKLLGYALGRSTQLSDKPLVEAIIGSLKNGEGRVGGALELIILSPQFRQVRGRDFQTPR